MDKSECLAADWYTVGFEDGSSGLPESHIAEYRKDCAQHAVTPNLERYRAGHYQGSKNFCNAANGFALGQRGREYKRSCPEDLQEEFPVSGYCQPGALPVHLFLVSWAVRNKEAVIVMNMSGRQ